MIVRVAAQYFLENGYAATTMSGIAATLGGSKGTLWSYFPSKEELFVAVLDKLTGDFRGQLSLILDPSQDLEVVLRRFCQGFLAKVTSSEGHALYRLIIAEAVRFPEIGHLFDERGPKPIQVELTEFLAGAMERGLLRKDDPVVAAKQLIGLSVSGARQRMLLGLLDQVARTEIEKDIDQALDLFLRAYAPA